MDTSTVPMADLEVVADIVPANPHWLSFTPDGKHAYVAEHESNSAGLLRRAHVPVPP